MSDPASTRSPAPKRKLLSCFGQFLIGLIILFVLVGVALGPVSPGSHYSSHSAAMQTARTIDLAMFQYSVDNNGNYPDGTSSTEAFQKLIDGGYLTDPGIFYIPLPGKTRAEIGQKLKPENVSFDLTSGVDVNAPDELPVVFMTGYKVTYAPGGVATPLVKPYPPFWTRTWLGWWRGEAGGASDAYSDPGPGIAVAYKSNSAFFKIPAYSANPDYTIHDFIPSSFDPKGKTYRQLTPDGPLAP